MLLISKDENIGVLLESFQGRVGHAVFGVLLSGPESPVAEAASIFESPTPNAPPRFSNPNANSLAVLNLRRSTDGWRVVVPEAAMDRIAAELRPPPTELCHWPIPHGCISAKVADRALSTTTADGHEAEGCEPSEEGVGAGLGDGTRTEDAGAAEGPSFRGANTGKAERIHIA